MLDAIVALLVLLWLLGVFAAHIASPFVHVLLIIALVVVVVRLARGSP